MISFHQPLHLLAQARQLRLGWISTLKLFGSYYFGRRAFLKKFFPSTVTLTLPEWGKVPLRTNGFDTGLLTQVFIRHDYRMNVSGVRRILDLGANMGMASLYLGRLFPEAEIACVEPVPQNLALLKKVIAMNGLRARVFEAAAGAESGSIDLYLADSPDSNSIYPGKAPSGVLKAALMSVPEIMAQMGWDSIDVLKIDIEGAEKEVIGRNNAWLRKVRVIIGETHVNVGYPYAQLKADLSPFGFAIETAIEETPKYGASFQGERSLA